MNNTYRVFWCPPQRATPNKSHVMWWYKGRIELSPHLVGCRGKNFACAASADEKKKYCCCVYAWLECGGYNKQHTIQSKCTLSWFLLGLRTIFHVAVLQSIMYRYKRHIVFGICVRQSYYWVWGGGKERILL